MNSNTNNFDVNTSSSHISPTRYAPHLSEFYPIVNSTSPRSHDRLPPPSPSGLNGSGLYNSRVTPASVRSGMSTISDLRTLITKRDIKNTVDAMRSLLGSSQGYAESLQEVSKHASSMAQSLEALARLKGCSDDTAERLLSASGLFYLLANHENIMSQCLRVALGDGLVNEMDEFQVKSKTMENDFKKNCKEQSMKLKLQERHNIKLSKRKTRNLLLYKESLLNLQTQLDQLETLRHDYYQSSYDLVESTCDKVLENVATVSRARVEISENIARKGWSGGGLDELLMDAEDPFGKDGEEEEEEEEEEEGGEGDMQHPQTQNSDDSGDKEHTITLAPVPSTKSVQENQMRSNSNGSDFLRGPQTPLRKLSSSCMAKSPLGHKNGSTRQDSFSEKNGNSETSPPELEEPAESAFDNSFSLPLAGSARSRESAEDDKIMDDANLLKGLSTLELDTTKTKTSLKSKVSEGSLMSSNK